VFTPLEWIAFIIIVAGIIKIITLLVNPSAWMNFAKSVYKNPQVVKVVALILTLIIFYYLYSAGITIVEILAVTAFIASLLMIALADEVDYFLKKYQTMVKKGNLWKTYWLYGLLWIVIMLWGLKELFL